MCLLILRHGVSWINGGSPRITEPPIPGPASVAAQRLVLAVLPKRLGLSAVSFGVHLGVSGAAISAREWLRREHRFFRRISYSGRYNFEEAIWDMNRTGGRQRHGADRL